jgi:hypothetical protein
MIGVAFGAMAAFYHAGAPIVAGDALLLAWLLMALFVAVSIAAGWWIVRHLHDAMDELQAGTERVASGE